MFGFEKQDAATLCLEASVTMDDSVRRIAWRGSVERRGEERREERSPEKGLFAEQTENASEAVCCSMGRGGRILLQLLEGRKGRADPPVFTLRATARICSFARRAKACPVSSRDRALTVADESIREQERCICIFTRCALARSLAHVRGCTCV